MPRSPDRSVPPVVDDAPEEGALDLFEEVDLLEDDQVDLDAPDDDEDKDDGSVDLLVDEQWLELESEADLSAPDDEDDDDELGDDLLDTQHDDADYHVDFRIETASEEALPVLPLRFGVELGGRRVPAVVDLSLVRSIWMHPDPEGPTAEVELRIRGTAVSVTVDVHPGPEPVLKLGLDVLHSRFLLRP